MGSVRSKYWALVLVLIQIQLVKVQGINHASQNLQRLGEQFQQFQALTQARLDALALNQNRNSSRGLERRVQTLNDHYHHMSQDMERLKQSTTQEMDGLREWSRRLERKNKRLESRLSLVERNLRENHCHVQIQKPEPSQDLLNLTLEFQSQEERLAALQVQRDELLVGLKGLQESLKNQVLRVKQLEGRLGEVLQWNGGNIRGSGRVVELVRSTATPQKDYEARRRTETRPGRILGGHTQRRLEGVGQLRFHNHSKAESHKQHSTRQPKHSKAQKPRPQLDSHQQDPTLQPRLIDYVPQPNPHHPLSQTRPYPIQQKQLQSRKTVQPPSQPPLQHPGQSSWPQPLSKAQSHPNPTEDEQSMTKEEAPQPQVSGILPQPHSESYKSKAGGGEDEKNGAHQDSVIHTLLQLPVRHKIPAQPLPKRKALVCNVDSMLFFPSASAENYVTFSTTLPDLSELSVCLWLRVEASHVGTLLSYATGDNDNQLVLYGRNSTASFSAFLRSSFASQPSISSSLLSPTLSSYASTSSPTLEFVIGDPVHRRLPVSSLLDARWHHLCVIWSSVQGRFWHYSDRRLISSGSSFRKGWEIPGGGAVVLGQEQDSVGGGFHPAEGFAGQVAGFRVWNRMLGPSEVEGVAEGKGVPRGVVLDMGDIKEVHGEVQQVACECLEHCA